MKLLKAELIETDKVVVYVRVGNKKVVKKVEATVNKTYHCCFFCFFYLRGYCRRFCQELEENMEMKVFIYDTLNEQDLRITPLKISSLSPKNLPDNFASNPYICNEKLDSMVED